MKSRYDIARKRVKKKNEFRSHLASYVICCAFLFAINFLTSPGYVWAIWPTLGWGVGVAFHAFHAYGFFVDEDEEDELIEQELRRLEPESPGDHDLMELREIKKEALYNEEDLV